MQENSGSKRIFLISSVILGVLATVISFAYLESSTSGQRQPGVRILMAKTDLRENTSLDTDKDVEELEVPYNSAMKDRCLRAENKLAYKGQRINRRVLAGTPLFQADLVAATDLTLDPTKMALSLPVRGAAAVSGLLVPGDHIKVLATRPMLRRLASTQPTYMSAAESSASWETVTITPEPLRVIAVGSRLSRVRMQITTSDQYQTAGESESQQSVTVEVTEEQAKAILQQTGAGQLPITLILCPPQKSGK